MPEGDTIYRSAERLRQVMLGATIVESIGKARHLPAEQLCNATISEVASRGKHLLMHIADGRVIHSHMGMTGSWHTYQPGEPWRKSARSAALNLTLRSELAAVETTNSTVDASTQSKLQTAVVVCFYPKILELLSPTQFRRHPLIHRLGPDLMNPLIDQVHALERFRIHNVTTIGEALMNQTIVCGIGNVYKSEVLFLDPICPFARVAELTDSQILGLINRAQSLMQKNITGRPRQTRLAFDGERLWVYGRGGKPCFECGTEVQMRRQGDLGRSTYWCPQCQPCP